MSRTINELNTTDTLADEDKFVIWQKQSQATRAITAQDMADYFTLTGGPYQPLDELLTAIAALGPSTSSGDFIQLTGQDTVRVRKLTVATYAALTNIAPAFRFDDMLVYVGSRAADGDGGDGWWRFDASSSATANGGTILAPDTGTGRWFRQDIGPLHIEWFATTQAAFDAAFALGRSIELLKYYTPPSRVTIRGTFSSNSSGWSLDVFGHGDSTGFYHDFDDYLFHCTDSLPTFMSFRDFKVISRGVKGATSQVFYFAGGVTKSRFSSLRIGHNGTAANAPAGLFDMLTTATIDTVEFRDNHLEAIKHRGYGIGLGSHIIFDAGRIIGAGDVADLSTATSTGIELYGNAGGVVIGGGIDLINLNETLEVTAANGTSNREITIGEAYFDSSFRGPRIWDASKVMFSNIWTASCGEAGVTTETTFTGTLDIIGGQIFNAGAVPGGSGHGIALKGAGIVNLGPVSIRSNDGTGVRSTGSVIGYMSGTVITDNATGFDASGTWRGKVSVIANNSTANLVRNSADLDEFIAGHAGKSQTMVTNASSLNVITHGLGIVPVYAAASLLGDFNALYKVTAWDATTVTFKIVDYANAGLGVTSEPGFWEVRA